MNKRLKPLVINGRNITDHLTIELAPFMTEDRALLVAQLRVERDLTFRALADTCGRLWAKPWGASQAIGAALCCLASAYLGEAWDYLDSL